MHNIKKGNPHAVWIMSHTYVDFEIVKEPWNKYSLADGSKLKTRVILKSVWFEKKNEKKEYKFDMENKTEMFCDTALQDAPNTTKWTPEDYNKNIDVNNCRYDTIAYEATEYLLDDGTQIVIHSNIGKIQRTKLYNGKGDRIYLVNNQLGVNITPQKN